MTKADDRQSVTSYLRLVVTIAVSRLVIETLTMHFSASATF